MQWNQLFALVPQLLLSKLSTGQDLLVPDTAHKMLPPFHSKTTSSDCWPLVHPSPPLWSITDLRTFFKLREESQRQTGGTRRASLTTGVGQVDIPYHYFLELASLESLKDWPALTGRITPPFPYLHFSLSSLPSLPTTCCSSPSTSPWSSLCLST